MRRCCATGGCVTERPRKQVRNARGERNCLVFQCETDQEKMLQNDTAETTPHEKAYFYSVLTLSRSKKPIFIGRECGVAKCYTDFLRVLPALACPLPRLRTPPLR